MIDTGEKKIACEISVSTSVEHETANVSKCHAAGLLDIYLISDDSRHLENIRNSVIKKLSQKEMTGVKFLIPSEMIREIQSLDVPCPSNRVRGYQVKRHWHELSQSNRERREMAFSKITQS